MKTILTISGWILAVIFAFLFFKGCGKEIIVPKDNRDSVKAVLKNLSDSTNNILKGKDSVIAVQQTKIIDLSNQVKHYRNYERVGKDSLDKLKEQINNAKSDSAIINYCRDYIDLTDQLADAVAQEHAKNDSLLMLLYSDTTLYRDQVNAVQTENKRLLEIIDVLMKEKEELRQHLIACAKKQKKPWLAFIVGVILGAATNLIHK